LWHKTNSVESKKMPAKLRGYHEVIGDHKNIYYREEDSLSGIQNTILHEIREMMETLFCEDNPTYIPLKTSARHLAANQFATAVLLPLLSFTAKVYDTGLDIIELSSQYSRAVRRCCYGWEKCYRGSCLCMQLYMSRMRKMNCASPTGLLATMKPTLTRMSSEQMDFSLEKGK